MFSFFRPKRKSPKPIIFVTSRKCSDLGVELPAPGSAGEGRGMSIQEGTGLLDARCPECSNKLQEHKDAPCIHTWIASLLAQMRYVEHSRDFWKRQYHLRQIEDASGYREALEAIRCNSEPNTLFNFGGGSPTLGTTEMYAAHIDAINLAARTALVRASRITHPKDPEEAMESVNRLPRRVWTETEDVDAGGGQAPVSGEDAHLTPA